MGPRKQVIAKVITPDEILSSVKFVFTEKFTRKCKRALNTYRKSLAAADSSIGVRIPKAGVLSEEQLRVMMKYYETMKSLFAVSDTMEWMVATTLSRLDIPKGLNEYAQLDKVRAAIVLQQVVLPLSRKTPFGMVSDECVFRYREDMWIHDDCVMVGMATLQEGYGPIGVISPGISGTECPETGQKFISGSHPFHKDNSTPNKITIFDPQQKEKQYEECEAFIKSQFPEMTAKMDFDGQLHPKQTDGHNCGPLVLLFFECSVRGIALHQIHGCGISD
ncbi:hypothetical protein DVH05_004219 [Phytophthora capsici]|nr:hypothetical protein DVH05_004219 [Phytophthora capsici]